MDRRIKHTRNAAAIVLALSALVLICDYLDARWRLPADKARLEELELAVREDASQTVVLNDEYLRQRDLTLARRTRADVGTILIIVSTAVFLISAKVLSSKTGVVPPSLQQIADHRLEPSDLVPWRKSGDRSPRNGDSPDEGLGSLDLTYVDQVIDRVGTSKEAAITILQRIQTHYRYLPDEALRRVCERTEITPAQIAGVSSFYAQFRRSPVGRYVIKVCHGTACHVSGAAEISDEIRRFLEIPHGADTDPRKEFTVDHVACIGCCSLAPVLMIEEKTVGGLSPVRASQAIEQFRRGHRR